MTERETFLRWQASLDRERKAAEFRRDLPWIALVGFLVFVGALACR